MADLWLFGRSDISVEHTPAGPLRLQRNGMGRLRQPKELWDQGRRATQGPSLTDLDSECKERYHCSRPCPTVFEFFIDALHSLFTMPTRCLNAFLCLCRSSGWCRTSLEELWCGPSTLMTSVETSAIRANTRWSTCCTKPSGWTKQVSEPNAGVDIMELLQQWSGSTNGDGRHVYNGPTVVTYFDIWRIASQ